MIVTPSTGLLAGDIQVPAPGGTIPAYRAMPASGNNFPVILVVQEIFGVHEHICDVVRRLAKLGHYAIAPELYSRQGDPSKIADIPTLIRDIVAKVSDAQVMADLDAAVAYAKASGGADATRLGITGFCWGGRIVLKYAAHNPGVRAAVAWYGPLARSYCAGDATAIDVAGQIKGAVLGLYGGADEGIPRDTIETMYAALASGGNANSQYRIYPDTPHAFFADYRPSYRKEQAEDGWRRATEWFKTHLG